MPWSPWRPVFSGAPLAEFLLFFPELLGHGDSVASGIFNSALLIKVLNEYLYLGIKLQYLHFLLPSPLPDVWCRRADIRVLSIQSAFFLWRKETECGLTWFPPPSGGRFGIVQIHQDYGCQIQYGMPSYI